MFHQLKITRRAMTWAVLISGVLLLGIGIFIWKMIYSEKPIYLTAPVVKGDLENAVLAAGVLEAFRQVDVGAQTTGQLKSLKVRVGDQVNKGQLLAEIDPVILQNELLVAKAVQGKLIAQKKAEIARQEEAKLDFRRQKILLSHHAVSQQDHDQAKMKLQVSQAEVKSLDSQICEAKVKIDSALAKLAYTRILAPMDGEVVSVTTLEGQTVNAEQSAPTILKLADLNTITVKAQVSEADVIRISPGQTVYFSILGEPSKKYYGKLRMIEPKPEKINNAIFFNALFDVPNSDHKLRLDMTVQVTIVLNHLKSTLLIPMIALKDQTLDGGYDVRVLSPNGSVSTRRVKIGVHNHVQAQVLEGLKEKDVVITSDTAMDSK